MTAAGRRRSTSAASTAGSGSRRRWCAASPTTSSTATAPIRALTELVDTTELWFVPVANPDGYDYTFTPGNRLWRKNLRDNDGDGRITADDGVDLNRNYPTKWGYDDEGSSPDAGSEAYRGTGPASEPETRALDRLMARVGFEFLVNYHSASEAVLYGTGWQVATPTPDDAVYEALVGDGAAPAVPGYDQGLTADLYTGNGILDEHAHLDLRHARRARRDEPRARRPPRPTQPTTWEPAGCTNAFQFPDDEALIEAEFRKNLPFALATARSAADPADPVTVTGRQAPEFVVDSFDVSYGDPQTVAVTARRDQHNQRLEYRVNGGRTQRARVARVEGRRALRRRARPLLRRAPGRGDGHPAGRLGGGVVHRPPRRSPRRERALHLHGGLRHRRRRADPRQRGLHRRQPHVPRRHGRAEVRRRVRRRPRRQRHQPRHLGRRRPGCPASARRAQPLRRRGVGDRRRPAGAGPRGRAHRHVPVRTRPRHRRRRAPAVPDDRAARLPQRGRQARPGRREHAVLRPARPVARRDLLRARRSARPGLRHHPRLPDRLPAAVRRLRPVLPRCAAPRHVRPSRPASTAAARSTA